MKKYNCFNRHYLKKHLQKLIQMKNELEISSNPDLEKYELVLDNIENIEAFLKNGDVNTLYDELDNTSMKEKMKTNKEYFKLEKRSLPVIRRFNDTYQTAVKNLDLESYVCDSCTDTAYTHKRILHMIHDFYISIPDKEIRQIFNKLYKNRINNVRFKNSEVSYCGSTGLDNKSYLSIDNSINFASISSIAHEYGHAIHNEYLGKFTSYNNDQYTELVSIFFQLLMNEFICDTQPKNKERAIQDSIGMLIKMDIYSNNLEVLNLSKNKKFKNEEEAYKFYLKYLYEEEAETALTMDAYLFNDYLIPYIIDIELLWEYKNDPEKALYKLKHLISNYEKDYLEKTQNLDLELNQHVYKYIKHLTKQ